MRRRRNPSKRMLDGPITNAAGFTLIEAVMVIAITGIVAAAVAIFIRIPVQEYFDTEARAQLTDVADTAARRIARDVRLALPNSVRVTTNGGVSYLEFLLTKTGGRYLASEDNPTAGTVLSFDNPAQLSFQLIGPMPAGIQTIASNDYVVVNNLGPGQAPVDAYGLANCGTPPGCNIARVTGVAGNLITLASNPFASQTPSFPSPSKHFQVVTGAVTYQCNPAAQTLTRYWNYPISSVQPNTSAAFVGQASALLATGVTACSFSYGGMASQRSALIGISLTLQVPGNRSGVVTLFDQVHVDNTP